MCSIELFRLRFYSFREMYHGDAWRNDSRFFSPMVKLRNGTSVFLKECVNIKYQEFGTACHRSCSEILSLG